MDIIIAIYLYSNFRGYFGSQGWWLCFIIVPSIYLLTEMVCICMLMAYLLLWLRSKYRSKYRNLDLCQGVVVSYIYIYHVYVTQTVPDISPLMPMHQDPLLVNFSGATVDVWEWKSNFIPHFTGDVITRPCLAGATVPLLRYAPLTGQLQLCGERSQWHGLVHAGLKVKSC